MALNYPGPYEVRIFYTVTVGSVALEHTQRLNCNVSPHADPGEEFNDITVVTRGPLGGGAGFSTLKSAVDDYVALMRGIYNTTTANIDRAELWRYTPGTFEAAFVSAYNIDLPGTIASATVQAGEAILTFRTIEGGIMKLAYEESYLPPGGAQSLGVVTGPAAAIRDYVLGSSNWILARDTSYPFAGYRYNPGQNEAIFKKRFRQL